MQDGINECFLYGHQKCQSHSLSGHLPKLPVITLFTLHNEALSVFTSCLHESMLWECRNRIGM